MKNEANIFKKTQASPKELIIKPSEDIYLNAKTSVSFKSSVRSRFLYGYKMPLSTLTRKIGSDIPEKYLKHKCLEFRCYFIRF